MGEGMEIVVEFEHRMGVCFGEAASLQKRETEMAESPWRADAFTIVSCRHLVAHPVGSQRGDRRHLAGSYTLPVKLVGRGTLWAVLATSDICSHIRMESVIRKTLMSSL